MRIKSERPVAQGRQDVTITDEDGRCVMLTSSACFLEKAPTPEQSAVCCYIGYNAFFHGSAAIARWLAASRARN